MFIYFFCSLTQLHSLSFLAAVTPPIISPVVPFNAPPSKVRVIKSEVEVFVSENS